MKFFNIKRLKKVSVKIFILSITLQASNTLAESQAGKALFEVTCAGCHGKTLAGGAGFNLKDEVWVHGSKPAEILNNVKNGFPNVGMPGFGGMYNDQQLKSIVDYVLSKRQGLDNLTYKIYHIDSNSAKSFEVLPDLPIKKSGKLPNNLLDFTLPEVKDYIIEFEADLYAPDEESHIFSMTHHELFEIQIDDVVIQPTLKEWLRWAWPIKAGKQRLKFRYSTLNTRKNNKRAFKLFVSNGDLTQKLFGISAPGKGFLNKATFNIKAETKEEVVRKKIVKLPTSSVAVGFPEKLNYAFNTKNCAIVGVWDGDLLNIGPNIEGRGRDGSLIGGKWKFHSPSQILTQTNGEACDFIKYSRNGNTTFHYRLGKQTYQLKVSADNSNTLTFNYTLLAGSDGELMITLPQTKHGHFSSKEGNIRENTFSVNAVVGQSYQITLALSENN